MDQATLTQFRNALLAAPNTTVPGAGTSPNLSGANPFVTQAIGHLQNLSRGTFQAQASGSAQAAAGGAAGAQADQEKADAKLALQQANDKLSTLQQAKQDMADPNKYRRVPNESGGWDYYDPLGNKISAVQYAYVKGQHITDALKGSQNIQDQKFSQDYDTILKIGQAINNNDKTALDKLYKADPTLKSRISGMSYSDIVKQFRQAYPMYFPQSYQSNVGAGGNTTPNQVGGGGGNFLSRLMHFFGS